MENYVQKAWAQKAIPDVCLLRAGFFLFNFKNKEDMNEILMSGPWFFGSRPLLLKPWTVGDDLEKVSECLYPMWIQLPALKLNLWNEKGISKITSVIGRPITTDKLTANRQRLAYARVLLEVKMPAPLPDQILIQGPNGKQYNQKVIYELKPRWCDYCKQVGHDSKVCRRHSVTQKWIPKINLNHPVTNAGNLNKQDNSCPHDQTMLGNFEKEKQVMVDENLPQSSPVSHCSVHDVHLKESSTNYKAYEFLFSSDPFGWWC
ncbi:uncharacterized protein LOC109828610 [Asparagus officinalis]|uniref:uncharacterized protein LOC109828610 n=1 Tax=Asparagus officinalis TaxID=4686 RepID=UPI00098E3FBA|nr:uncharacterized protein LOC109828610 [Asparagus officinalis]